jgi:tRNA (mo5U34)-methyltransferase
MDVRTGGSAAEIQGLGPWFHNLHLPDGTQTRPDHPLGDFPRFKWQDVGATLPQDMRGLRALDIGCNAGFYSIELARRGADVLAIDIDEHYLRQARWAAARFGVEDSIRFQRRPVYSLGSVPGTFDLVLFMGVFYHLRHPLLALDIVAEKVGGTLVFQTLTMPGDEVTGPPADLPLDARDVLRAPGWPKMAFLEHRLAGDPTNWWAPDHACIEAMLRSAGFAVQSRPAHEIYLCTREPAWDPMVAGLVQSELRQVREGSPA